MTAVNARRGASCDMNRDIGEFCVARNFFVCFALAFIGSLLFKSDLPQCEIIFINKARCKFFCFLLILNRFYKNNVAAAFCFPIGYLWINCNLFSRSKYCYLWIWSFFYSSWLRAFGETVKMLITWLIHKRSLTEKRVEIVYINGMAFIAKIAHSEGVKHAKWPFTFIWISFGLYQQNLSINKRYLLIVFFFAHFWEEKMMASTIP